MNFIDSMIKREIEREPVDENVDMVELEKLIAEQNEDYYDIYDEIASLVAYEDQVEYLILNRQFVPKTKTQVSDFE